MRHNSPRGWQAANIYVDGSDPALVVLRVYHASIDGPEFETKPLM